MSNSSIQKNESKSDGYIQSFKNYFGIDYSPLATWIRTVNSLTDFDSGLGAEIIHESQNPVLNPEIQWLATVRESSRLCWKERRFLRKRRKAIKPAFARYLRISETSINEDDIPTIGVTGSGGGLRAMIATSGYLKVAQEDGFFQCLSYLAGVSGSTWGIGLFYSLADQDLGKLKEHYKHRLQTHLASPSNISGILENPTLAKNIFRSLIEKFSAGYCELSISDLYGVLLSGRLFVPSQVKPSLIDPQKLKISAQSSVIKHGHFPMPIYSSVRHDIPSLKASSSPLTRLKQFQWFETTPYEFGCEDFRGWIPTWAQGRKFNQGVSIGKVYPETSMTLLFGIYGSAFCATLSHYYQEIKPLLPAIQIVDWLNTTMAEKDNELIGVHPITPSSIPNYMHGLEPYDRVRQRPSGLDKLEAFSLMDAGMVNNLATFPLIRPQRNVDVVVAFDSSADINQVEWLEVTDRYAQDRKIEGWPVKKGWRKERYPVEKEPDPQSPEAGHINPDKTPEQAEQAVIRAKQLAPCEIWFDEPKLDSGSRSIGVAYFPLVANERVPGIDPAIDSYMSTWNFEYTPDEIENIYKLTAENYRDGAEKLRDLVRRVYEYKKKRRQQAEIRNPRLFPNQWD